MIRHAGTRFMPKHLPASLHIPPTGARPPLSLSLPLPPHRLPVLRICARAPTITTPVHGNGGCMVALPNTMVVMPDLPLGTPFSS